MLCYLWLRQQTLMRTATFLVCILCLAATQLQAQTNDEAPRGHLGIMAGTTLPTGSFGREDWSDDKSGYAENGVSVTGLDFSIKFVPNFGIAGALRGFNTPLDVKYLANKYAETYGGQFRVESKRWNFGGLFAGPFLSVPVGNIFDIDLRFMPGIFLAFAPEIVVSRGNETAVEEPATGASIGMNIGLTGRFHLSPRFSFMLQADYLTARPRFLIEQNNGNFTETVTAFQDISTVNLSAGFALRIFRR
jgi:hypothetical protein